MSWKVAQNVITNLVSADKTGKLKSFASQENSKKIQNKMNSQLLGRKVFGMKIKRSVKFVGVLKVEKPGDQRYQIYEDNFN